MNLINLNGLALIGPGSEWFWSMLQFVIVALTLYAIYRQLRLQASASAIEQATALQRDWHASELLMRSRLAVLIARRDGADPGATVRAAASEIGNFWERVGLLVRAGHLDRRLVYEYLGGQVQLWWALLAATEKRWRDSERDSSIHEHFEWLADVSADLDRSAGTPLAYDEAHLAALLKPAIEADRESIRTAEELRAVIVRPMSTSSFTAD